MLQPLFLGTLPAWLSCVPTNTISLRSCHCSLCYAVKYGRHLPLWEQLLENSRLPSSSRVPLRISVSGTRTCTPGRTFPQPESLQMDRSWVVSFLAQDVVTWGWLLTW